MTTEKNEAEVIISCSANKGKDAEFDEIVGQIEDIIISETFEDLQKNFMDKYYHQFNDNEENKLEYTMIFQEYQNKIEHHIETELQRRIQNFSMDAFLKQMMLRKQELEGEVYEVLLTFSDFLEFKNLMLDYKRVQRRFHAAQPFLSYYKH